MNELLHFGEPSLLFRYDQSMLDPRDGLTLFGPLDKGKPYGIRWGLIGTPDTIDGFRKWIASIQKPVGCGAQDIARPPFPGFEAVFGIPWPSEPVLTLTVDPAELQERAHLADAHQRVFRTVDLFSEPIVRALHGEDVRPDVWCVVIPDFVKQKCSPMSRLAAAERVEVAERLTPRVGRSLYREPELFPERNALAEPYWYELNFHHQLKARLLSSDAPIQIVREPTITFPDVDGMKEDDYRKLEGLKSAVAWHIATAVFYKAGGRPWKLGGAREGVCYVGLVYKNVQTASDSRTACCAAQMFLDSGDGVVFKGAVGPWYGGKAGEYHLDRRAAEEVIRLCVDTYRQKRGQPPKQVFVHGRVNLRDDEWSGFQRGAGSSTQVIGVRIRPGSEVKIYRKGDNPVLRGLAYVMGKRRGSLWTRGFVPRLRTYPGREVPNPLQIEVCRGEESIETVMSDVLSLTKLNYNACQFADGLPVTLKFANAVGEILTAGPLRKDVPPLPFKYYI
ncbi:MAG: hypothetical protein AB1578_11555 [Thermodesulfobacteriota bacterium]